MEAQEKNWNTDTLLKELIKGAEENNAETELIYLNDLNYKGCISCMGCKLKNGKKYRKMQSKR